MAGGKQSPRQKMINLMYLVFIAMMALNMSKEVLSAFGLMNERISDSNASATVRNNAFMQGLADKVAEQPAKYQPIKAKADQIDQLSSTFNNYIEGVKTEMLKTVKDPSNYEEMDRTDHLDQKWFSADNMSKDGQEFLNQIKAYREGVIQVLGEENKDIQADIMKKFATDDVKTSEGITKGWLNYHFAGFPMVASLTKLTQMQADVKTIESEVLSSMLAGEQVKQLSMRNYSAIVIPEKTAFFSGENFKGKVVLGRFDNTLNFENVVINGNKLENIEGGQVVLDFPAGAVGERDIKGTLQFKEGDEIVDIPIVSKYAVVPKPNSATISADKMNVVYRGVDNPMTISFAGISDDKVQASAPGLSKSGKGYSWNVTSFQGNEATVTVTGTLPDGTKVSDKKTFKVRGIPAPVAKIRGSVNSFKGNKNDLANSPVQVAFPDFVYDVNVTVTGFEVFVPGQPAIIVTGDRMSDAAKKAIATAQRGDKITINNVKTALQGAPGYRMPGSSPFIWEVN